MSWYARDRITEVIVSAASLLSSLPIREILDLVDVLLEEGVDHDEAVDAVVEFLDQLLVWGEWVPGPAGEAIESIDGPVLRAALGLILSIAGNSSGRERRKARRESRREDRREKRSARRAARSQS